MTSSESVDAQSAKSYALVGFIFYALSAVGWLLPLGIFGGLLNGPPFNADIPSNVGILVLLVFAIPIALTAGFAAWSWITVDNIGKGKYAEAQTATIILGIFGIFLAWFIGGIFLLLAYGKLGDVIRGPQAAQAPPQRTGRMCTSCGRPVAWDAKFCEHCGKDLA